MKSDVAIAGAGLSGRLLAWRLASQGLSVEVFDAGAIDETSKAAAYTAAAMLSPISELVASEKDIFDLGMASIPLWQQWCNDLEIPHCFHQAGSLIIAHSGDSQELTQFERDLSFKLPSAESGWKKINQQQHLAELEPDLNPEFKQGIFLPQEAHLDHIQIMEQLLIKAQQAGAVFHPHSAVNNIDALAAKWVIDCRGFGRKADQNTEDHTSLRGVRGEVITLECKDFQLNRPIRLMHPRYKLYLVPKPDNRFVLGATELESEDTSSISLRSAMELMSALYTISPALAEARIVKTDSNLRPAYFDNLPKVSNKKVNGKHTVSINGLYRHGYLISPALVSKVEKLILP